MYVILNNGNLVQKYNVEYAKYAHPVYPTLFPEYYPTLEGEISKITAEGFAYETIKNHKNGLPWSNAVYTASGTQVDGNSYSYYNSGHLGYGQPVQVVKSDNGSKSLYTYDYTYDKHGNILTQIEYREFESENQNYDSPGTDYYTEMVRNVSYEYDNLDRLTKETVDGVEKTYTYDAAGNITTKTTIDKTYVYEYNNSWKDQLSKLTVNGVEEQFVYNNIGLPTKYRNQPMAWNNRNLLADYKNVLFTYDGTGMRLAKSTYVEIIDDDGTKRREITGTTTFDYEGDRLLSESRNGTPIRYVYGASGVIGFKYNGANYYFVRNLQGDVTRIVDANNQIFAQYTYDAWGNCTIVTDIGGIASLNAIRYRGYYFDSETGLYYLQTRYYDPEICRFISPDSTKYLDPETLGGLNLYAYCINNPVMYADPNGNAWETVFDIVSLGLSVIEVAATPTNPWAWAGLAGDLVDLIPFVTGCGETVKAMRITNKAGDVIDTAKDLRKTVKTTNGSYEIIYESGMHYVGKGGFSRAIDSAIQHSKPNLLNNYSGDIVSSIRWRYAPTSKRAFVEEYALQSYNRKMAFETYNIITSPGKKIYETLGKKI